MASSPVAGTPTTTTVSTEKFNVLSIVALVLSIFLSIIGAILGFVALAQIKRTGQRGRGLALAAVVIGLVLFVVGVVVDLAVLPQLMNAATTAP